MVIAGWVLMGVYAALVMFFVVRGALRTKTISDYAVGNIAFSPLAVGLSLAASMTSAATFIINPGLIALYGVSGVIATAVVVPIGCLGSLWVLTKGFRRHGKTVKANTLAQWIGTRFRSPRYALFFGFVNLLLITFIVLICVGLTKVLSKTLNVSELAVLVGLVVFIFGYMTFGGANSMVYTNTIQACLMIVVAFILLGSGYQHFSDGVHGFLDKLRAIDPNLVAATNPKSFLFRDWFEIGLCQLVVGVAVVCQPHILTKSLLLRSDRDTSKFLTTTTLVMVLFFLVVIAGLYARLTFPSLTVNGAPLRPDGILSAYVVKEFPVWVGIIVVMGLISAGVSTLEGLIQSVSTSITSDIIRPLFGRFFPADEARRDRLEVNLNRAVIAVLGAAAVLISYDQLVNPKLSVAILAQNGVYAFFAAAFIPVLFGTFLKEVPTASPVAASVTALVVHFAVYYGELTPYMKAPVKNPGIAATIAILSSVVVGTAVLVVSRRLAHSRSVPRHTTLPEAK
jgi:sodium/pantothenate symporter